jgi:hypothetical protein
MARVYGKFLKPDSTPMAGVVITAFLTDMAGESAGEEIYAANQSVTATSSATGAWEMNLWANDNGVLPTKYTFVITFKTGDTPVKYDLTIPNTDSILFSDLLISYTAAQRATELTEQEPVLFDMTITQGNTVRKKFEVLDSSNQPMNLTGWRAKLALKDNNSNWTATYYPVVTELAGTISMVLPSADTWLFKDKAIIYELLVWNTTDVIKLLYGSITVTPSFANIGDSDNV